MKRYIFFFLLSAVLVSCGGVSDARIDAYNSAMADAEKAGSSAELVSIAYSLSNRLDSLDKALVPMDTLRRLAADGNSDSRELLDSIESARARYADCLSRKEMGFYVK